LRDGPCHPANRIDGGGWLLGALAVQFAVNGVRALLAG